MNRREQGFLLLTSKLGDPDRKTLTLSQLRTLAERAYILERYDWEVELETEHLLALGYDREMAGRILRLLEEEDQLNAYLKRAARNGCECITRAWAEYPLILRKRMGMRCPGTLWLKGERKLLNTPAVALVGSRNLNSENRDFAYEVGRQAALQGITLISGNAKGADSAAQEACLSSGGNVISIVADRLADHEPRDHVLYVSENEFDEPFSAQRALERNHVIHAMGQVTFVAQCSYGKGGTWNGATVNLRRGWSPVFCFRDGSAASLELERLGAQLISFEDLKDLSALAYQEQSLFDL